jgi:signal transduction histidine kinase
MTNIFFQDLIDAMPQNVAIVEESGRIIYTNKAWVEFSENNSGDLEFTDKQANYFKLVHASAQSGDVYAKKVSMGIQDILSKKRTIFELEYPCHSPNRNCWFIVNIKELKNNSPRLFLFTHKDITQLVEREERVIAAQRLEAVGQLSGGIAHDFNNLLTIFSGNLQLAKTKYAQNQNIDIHFDNALVAIDTGTSLVKQLLSYARKQSLKLESIDLNSFIKSTTKFIRSALSSNIQIVSELNDLPIKTIVDSSMLGNAILNIAINAMHAMPKGGILSIMTSFEELNGSMLLSSDKKVFGSYALISISDNGVGINKENMNKVFEPFFTTKEVGEGCGLGLSMVFGFIKQSNGHIDIVSSCDNGTTVYLYLPLDNNSSSKVNGPTIMNLNND